MVNNQKSPNEILGMKSIKEYQQKGFVKDYFANMKLAWYFEKWYEKLILVVLGILGIWKIVGFF